MCHQGSLIGSQSSPVQFTDYLCYYQYNKKILIGVIVSPCMLLRGRYYINSRFYHFSFTHKQIRKWINIYWVNILFTTPRRIIHGNPESCATYLQFKIKPKKRSTNYWCLVKSDWEEEEQETQECVRPVVQSCRMNEDMKFWPMMDWGNVELEIGLG